MWIFSWCSDIIFFIAISPIEEQIILNFSITQGTLLSANKVKLFGIFAQNLMVVADFFWEKFEMGDHQGRSRLFEGFLRAH